MKKLLGILLAGSFLAGCGKVRKIFNDFGSATFLNVVPFSPPPPGSLAVTMRVYEDTLMPASGISIVVLQVTWHLHRAPRPFNFVPQPI